MRKFFSKYFPWAVIVIFFFDIYHYWNTDQDAALMAIVGAIGWASFIEVRAEYESFYDMIEGKVKDDKTQG
jgi:hypothetical protein